MAMTLASLNNILVAHIESEVSGTIDEHIRHSVSKLSHIHFVSNKKAAVELKDWENLKTIHIVGSIYYDLMFSKVPSLNMVKKICN